MNDQTYLQIQTVEIRRLQEIVGADPILAPQLQARLDELQKELAEITHVEGSVLPKENVVLPRAAIFLRRGGVQDSEGIRPSLAGEILIQYEKLYIGQALHDEREAARKAGRHRRRRGAPTPTLLFTGTPRGSFGLEFVPQPTEDVALINVHAESLRHVAEALLLVAQSEAESLDGAVKRIPPSMLQPLKKFMGTLSQFGAELRLAFPDQPSKLLSVEQVTLAAERLEKEISEETVEIEGVFRGLTRESGYFDLNPVDGNTITGHVAESLDDDDLDRIDSLTNSSCKAILQKTTVQKIDGATSTYVLLDAQSITSSPADPRI